MSVSVTPLAESELDRADHIFRLSFGTFVGLPDPASFGGDADYVRTRWRADPSAALAARDGARLLGSNFAVHWGSFGFFGPVSVHPDHWRGGVAHALVERTIALFDEWGVQRAGLFTFSHSPLHLRLYQRFDFWPQHLTALCAVRTDALASALPRHAVVSAQIDAFSALSLPQREAALAQCLRLTDEIDEGLDVGPEIRAVAAQGLGETVLLRDDNGDVEGFAVCHVGAGTEAGSDALYVKFAAVRAAGDGSARLERLLAASARHASAHGVGSVVAGVNTARVEAYRLLLARGFRAETLGVAMQRGRRMGPNQPGVFVLDDWR